MKDTDRSESWLRTLCEPHPYEFAVLILAGLAIELVVHFYFGIAVVYTHFYYLVIVIAGLWYGRNAIWIALFFGGLHVAVTWSGTGGISLDSLIRAAMFCIVAFVVGIIAEQMNHYRDQLEVQNRDLKEINTQLDSSKKAFETANKKLNLLSSITRHDIKNQLTALLVYVDLLKMTVREPEVLGFVEKEEIIAQTINRQIEFTKDYEEIGVRAPQWQNVGLYLDELRSRMQPGDPDRIIRLDGLEIFADPLLEKVFENLIDNSRRHGERVRHISVSSIPYGNDEIAIVYEDDGIGIHEADKKRIFEKGFGKNTGLGLFLSREILSITGLGLKETGIYGKGARFEILVPQGKFRFTPAH